MRAAESPTTQSVFAGSYTVEATVTKGTPIVTVKPNSAAPEEAPAAAADEVVDFTPSDAAKSARITESKEKQATGRPELTEAAIVVSGGRGTGGDFSKVEAFADSLGAAVGASRAAVDAGWYRTPRRWARPAAGQPAALRRRGISGAIQHRAGMQTSKTIVAVNKDNEAPIFELVDFGVVGDLFSVLPQATGGDPRLQLRAEVQFAPTGAPDRSWSRRPQVHGASVDARRCRSCRWAGFRSGRGLAVRAPPRRAHPAAQLLAVPGVRGGRGPERLLTTAAAASPRVGPRRPVPARAAPLDGPRSGDAR